VFTVRVRKGRDGNKEGGRQDVRKKFDGERDRNEEGSGEGGGKFCEGRVEKEDAAIRYKI
jgi:hypothetical protein